MIRLEDGPRRISHKAVVPEVVCPGPILAICATVRHSVDFESVCAYPSADRLIRIDTKDKRFVVIGLIVYLEIAIEYRNLQ